MDKTSKTMIHGSVVLLSLILLPGCGILDFFKKKEEPQKVEAVKAEGVVLCSIDSKPVIHEGSFNKNINQMLQASPYFRGAGADALPLSIKRKFFDELVKQELIIVDANKGNIEKDAEFIKAYHEMKDLLKRSLKIQFFEKKLYDGIKIEASDVQKHYSENKEHYVKVAGGVLVSGIKFDQDAQATSFVGNVKSHVDEFDKLAKENKSGKFKEFGRVSKESRGFNFEAVPAPIKEAVLAAHKLPMVEKVKVGKEFWVIKAADKKETVYFNLDEIKQQIEGMLKNNKFKDALDGKIKELRGSHAVVVNEDYFKEKKSAEGEKKENGESKEDKEGPAAEGKPVESGAATAAQNAAKPVQNQQKAATA